MSEANVVSVQLGSFAKKTMDLTGAMNTANQMLNSGRNVLNRNNLNALSSWESNPVGNLAKGINPGTSPNRQIGIGGKINDWGIR